jgi:uncharacterized NAD(P)/FAD-binding protein YdhS
MLRTSVAIVGGGFSGVMVAAHLSRRLDDGASVTLIEPDTLGKGAAYGTRYREHLLNTRAGAMSAFDAEPDHFVRWLGSRGTAEQFVSRVLYGEYLSDIARQLFARPRFVHVRSAVMGIRALENGHFSIETDCRTHFDAELLVLATGTPLPSADFLPPDVKCHPGYVSDPWRFDYRNVRGHVLLAGSGLTALDVLVALEACGNRCTVHVVSRHGRFPQVHAAKPLPYDVVPALDPSCARTLLRSFRRHLCAAERRGFDWRAVVDAIRPESEALWRRLSVAERRRFDRHVRSHWERVRHRAPQAVDAVRRRYAEEGRLRVHPGRIVDARGGDVTVSCSDGTCVRLRPDWIFNCTGIGRSHTFGLDPQEHAGGLWLTGALLRGKRFESTAVPELRVIAEHVAGEIVRALRVRVSLTG